ncbi:DNA-binding LacI/PurR family transcriptional regulator [Kribbella sp. VKM Ac-2527]|uniref:DNA-binding LacI/PurR family transcriptional regulator n=1 Tax=Kribbella caucasensis TaxID=2512215 RepID=A0A4R6KM32_9ACTN|nr:LacI family DNA-binding transcriptional regulator [Kribbella sp. VKM Ac-2527]TDO51445.1 DNA-binding LacI/PurR family transcriptional regulator [Kribbella sp. VKM Ac-2527]
MTRPTMEDVAAHAGVSRALVSIVYRDVPGASDATRARVLAAGAELGYRPDHRARLLGRQRTRLIGVTFDVRGAFHGDLIESLYPEAESLGYDLTLSAVTAARPESQAIQSLLDYRCEALILLGPTSTPSSLAALAESQPTVVVARKVRAPGVHVVRTDDDAGARLAVEHLLSLGHTHIAHIDGGRAPGAAERRTAYRNTMRRAGLTPLIIPGGPTESTGTAAAHHIPADTTAVTAFNDGCAIGLLHALHQSGRQVPENLSLTGYDNTPAAALPHANLTTVAQDAHQLTKLAIIALTQDVPTTEQTVSPVLITRGSTMRR